ncbi:MAG TPA: dipeptide epimerase [Lachnospiraceae bacterium]|nr:dipeptide epimerase [Lachnospiraceae bacterium]
MHITGIRTGRLEAPLITPFKTAIRTVDKIEDLTVFVETDGGLTGLGEAAPTAPLTGDTFISMENAIRAYIAPAILGMEVTSDPASLEMVFGKMKSSIARNTSAKAAVDIALYDLFAKIKEEPLYRALGGLSCDNTAAGCSTGLSGGTSACAPFVETDITISVNPIPEMVRDSLKAAERGFHILKLKTGLDAKTDLERIAEIRRAVGPKMRIRVDANQGWTPDTAVKIIRGIEDAGIGAELVEQPVRADDIEGLAFVTKHVDTKILADESVFSARDAREIIRMKAADFINIKLMKTGGIHEALCISRLAEEAGVECMMGCMLESGISVGAAAHLAVSRKNITMADLDGPVLASKNPYSGGPVYDGAVIRMNETPGIGIFMGTVPTGVSYGEK